MTAHTGPGGPAGDLVFDNARIRARAAELDLGPEVFARQTGVSLGELARLGPTRVSVAQLARIAAVLDLPLDDLITTTSPAGTDPPEPGSTPREADPRDDQLVEALLLRFGRFGLDELAAVLGWTHTRTYTAVSALQQRWDDDTALRISGTADHFELGLRAGVLPTAVRARVIARRHAHTPLTPAEAGNLLRLIPCRTAPPGQPQHCPEHPARRLRRRHPHRTRPRPPRPQPSRAGRQPRPDVRPRPGRPARPPRTGPVRVPSPRYRRSPWRRDHPRPRF